MKFLRSLIAAVFITGSLSILWADAPGILNYQGKLTDQNGNPITDGAGVAMEFSLYNVASGGSYLFRESRANVPVDNGVFTVQIGSETAGGIPKSIFQTNTTLYLGVKVGADAEMTPRERLVSAPYALAIATGSVGANEIIDSTITLSKVDLASFDSRYSATSPSTMTVTYSVFMATAGGRVGVGTTDPQSTLHVNGDLRLRDGATIYYGSTNLTSFGNNNFLFGLSVGAPPGGYNVGFAAGTFSAGDRNTMMGFASMADCNNMTGNTAYGFGAMRCFGGSGTYTEGNTGIGSSSLYRLDGGYANTALGYSSLGFTTDGDENVGVGIAAGESNQGGNALTLLGAYADVVTDGLANATAIGYRAQVGQSNSLVLGSTGAYAVNVGIGTTAPNYRLHVASGVTTGTIFAVSTGSVDLFRVLGTSVNLKVPLVFPDGSVQATAAGGASQWTTNGSSIGYTGNAVGIGTTSPSAKLQINETFASGTIGAKTMLSSNLSLTDTAATDVKGQYIGMTFSGTGDTANIYGSDININKTDDGAVSGVYGSKKVVYVGPTGGGAANIYGDYNDVTKNINSSSTGVYGTKSSVLVEGDATTMIGGDFTADVGEFGDISDLAGVRATVNRGSAGAVTNMSGLISNVNLILGTVTNVYGGRFTVLVDGGATNAYGIKIEAMPSGSGRWSLYSDGGLSYFKDSVGIGTTTPSYRLQVSSGAGTTGTVFAVSTGAVNVFSVLGSSVNLKVPLVFPDGTVQTTAGGVASQWTTNGSSIGYTAGGVGIGTTAPAYNMEISSAIEPTIGFLSQDTDIVTYDSIGSIHFRGLDSGLRTGAIIRAMAWDDWGADPLSAETALDIYLQSSDANDFLTKPSVRFGNGWIQLENYYDEGGVIQGITGDIFDFTNAAGGYQFRKDTSGTTRILGMYYPNAGESGSFLFVNPTLTAMDGSDAVRGILVDLANANHTGSGNILKGVDIDSITGDAQAVETGLSVGAGWDYAATFSGDVGIGTATPTSRLHVAKGAGEANAVFRVSTGPVDVFAVHGTSVSLEVPLVFPDGTSQASAAVASQWTTNGSSIGYTAGGVGIGRTDPRGSLEVVGSAGNAALIISSGTTAGQELVWVSSQGYVGIGTTIPTEALEIKGNIQLGVNNRIGLGADPSDFMVSGNVLFFGWNTSSANAVAIGLNGGSGNGANTGIFFPDRDTTAVSQSGKEIMRIGASGYHQHVGIGTTSPLYRLHVSSGSTAGTVMAVSTGAVDLFAVHGTSVSLEVPLVFPDGTTQTTAGGAATQWTTNGSSIGYTGGNVGIGTTDPAAPLEIRGRGGPGNNTTGNLRLADSVDPSLFLYLGYDDLSNHWGYVQSMQEFVSERPLALNPYGGNVIITWVGNHRVGVGTNDPQSKMDVGGDLLVMSSAAVSGIGITGANPIFKVGGATLTATADGKVGIGTTNPVGKLDVVGSAGVPALVISSGTAVGQELLRVSSTGWVEMGGQDFFYIKPSAGKINLGNDAPQFESQGLLNLVGDMTIQEGSALNLFGSGGDGWLRVYSPGDNQSVIEANGNAARWLSLLSGAGESLVLRNGVGIGTTMPRYRLDVTTAAGVVGPVFAVSTGSVDLFRVLGTSVNLKVPLVFPDGTVQTTAAGTASQWTTNGSSIGYTGGWVGVGTTAPQYGLDVSSITRGRDRLLIGPDAASDGGNLAFPGGYPLVQNVFHHRFSNGARTNLHLHSYIAGSSSLSSVTLIGQISEIISRADSSANISSIIGSRSIINHAGSGIISNYAGLKGHYASVSNMSSNSPLASLIGSHNEASQGGGSIKEVVGVLGRGNIDAGVSNNAAGGEFYAGNTFGGAASADSVIAVKGFAFDRGAASFETMYGGSFDVSKGGANASGEAGGIFAIAKSTSGSVTNLIAGRFDTEVNGGSVTNVYGVYINTVPAGANSYSLYAKGGKAHFADQVGIGTTNPVYRLHVSSAAGEGGTIFAVSTGPVNIFAVHGTSVSMEVPLVFPDGSVQTTAASGSVSAHQSTHMDGGGDRLTGSLTLTTATLTGSAFSVGTSTFSVRDGAVGIGTSVPGTYDYRLHTTASNSTNNGIWGEVVRTGGTAAAYGVSGTAQTTSAGTVPYIYGVEGISRVSGSGGANNAGGGYFWGKADTSAPSWTNVAGIRVLAEAEVEASSVTGLDIPEWGNVGAGALTDANAIWVHSPKNTGGGSLGTAYGLVVDNVSAAGTNYSIYTNAGDVVLDAGNNAGTQVGIGRTNPVGKLDVVGSAGIPALVISSGTAAGQELIFVSSKGFVGIGKTTQYYPTFNSVVEILNNKNTDMFGLHIQNPNLGSGAYTSIVMQNGGGGAAAGLYALSVAGSGVSTIGSSFYLYDYARGAYRWLMDPQGRMGIGTTTPGYRLHVSSAAGYAGTVMAVSTGTVDLFAVHGTSVSLEVPLVFPDGTVQTTAGTASQWTTNGSSIGFIGGNVGIGTTAPGSNRLHVYSPTGRADMLLESADDFAIMEIRSGDAYHAGLLLGTQGGGVRWQLGNVGDDNDKFALYNWAGTEYAVVVDSSSRVGIGTTSPSDLLHIDSEASGGGVTVSNSFGSLSFRAGDAGAAQIWSDVSRWRIYMGGDLAVDGTIGTDNGDLTLQTAGTDRMTILEANGRVGINTATPNYQLQVATAAGVVGPVFAVSTGPVNVFSVLGTSVNLKVPLVFPDGTAQSTAYGSAIVVKGNSGGSMTVDWSAGSTQHVTLTGACAFTLSGGASGRKYTLILKQDGTGGYTPTWGSEVRWPSGTAPTVTGTANKTTYIGFIYNSVDSKYDGIAVSNDF